MKKTKEIEASVSRFGIEITPIECPLNPDPEEAPMPRCIEVEFGENEEQTEICKCMFYGSIIEQGSKVMMKCNYRTKDMPKYGKDLFKVFDVTRRND